ncbi:MAG: DUF1826 domain-containing protein [Alphaproteobacteria bacterium]|nr:DUF1826 domain-containing protein [Alphaproteobacteria bacterium]
MIRKIFGQAIIADYPAALRHIQTEDINLAIWQSPLSDETKSYLKKLQLKKLTRKNKWYGDGGYWTYLGKSTIIEPFSQNLSQKDKLRLIQQTFGNLPSTDGKEALSTDILKLTQEFAKATNCEKMSFNFLVFKARPQTSFWHTDIKSHRGIITLKGNLGTIWQPNKSLPRTKDRNKTYWGYVKPDDTIQQMKSGDFAIFKCQDSKSPLVHATPPTFMTRGYRLALLMGPDRSA